MMPLTDTVPLVPFPTPPPLFFTSLNVAFYLRQDGDLSTSWTCSGDPQGVDDPYYDCNVYFNLYSYRHVKQVKIGEPPQVRAGARTGSQNCTGGVT